MFGMETDEEVLVSGVGVETGFSVLDRADFVGEGAGEKGGEVGVVVGVDVEVAIFGLVEVGAAAVFGAFHGGVVEGGEAVEVGALAFPNPHRGVGEGRGVVELVPEEDFAADFEGDAEFGEFGGDPGAGGEDEFLGSKDALVGGEADAGAVGFPSEQAFAGEEGGSVLGGELGLGADAGFGAEVAAFGIEIDKVVVRDVEGGIAGAGFGGGEAFVRKLVDVKAALQPGHEGTAFFSDTEQAGEVEEGLLDFGLEFAPEVIAAMEKRDVVGVEEVGFADDAGVAVGAALVVAGREGVDAGDAQALGGQVAEGGGTHGTDAGDDDVEGGGHGGEV